MGQKIISKEPKTLKVKCEVPTEQVEAMVKAMGAKTVEEALKKAIGLVANGPTTKASNKK